MNCSIFLFTIYFDHTIFGNQYIIIDLYMYDKLMYTNKNYVAVAIIAIVTVTLVTASIFAATTASAQRTRTRTPSDRSLMRDFIRCLNSASSSTGTVGGPSGLTRSMVSNCYDQVTSGSALGGGALGSIGGTSPRGGSSARGSSIGGSSGSSDMGSGY
jgi:hypothetical protein